MVYTKKIETPLGSVLLASDGSSLTGLWFEGQAHEAEGLGSDRTEADLKVFRETQAWLSVYFAGRDPSAAPRTDPRGTPFQKRVWDALRAVPYGQTVTYGALAKQLQTSARAIGSAVSRNPVSLLIPCHRIVGTNGALTGYAGGLDRKRKLIALERSL